jgi:hypothetical protein
MSVILGGVVFLGGGVDAGAVFDAVDWSEFVWLLVVGCETGGAATGSPKPTDTPPGLNGTELLVVALIELEPPATPMVALPLPTNARNVIVATNALPDTGLTLPFWMLTRPLLPPLLGVLMPKAPPL